jgi:hypothetical protein
MTPAAPNSALPLKAEKGTGHRAQPRVAVPLSKRKRAGGEMTPARFVAAAIPEGTAG